MKTENLRPRSLAHYSRECLMVAVRCRGFQFQNHEHTINYYLRHYGRGVSAMRDGLIMLSCYSDPQ